MKMTSLTMEQSDLIIEQSRANREKLAAINYCILILIK